MSEVMPPGGGEQPPGYGQPFPPQAPQGPPPPAPPRPETFEAPPPYVPTPAPVGPGAAAHYGTPLGIHDPGAYVNPNAGGPRYAGFWRRAWARWITSQLAGIVLGAGYSLILFGTFWVHENTAVCNITASGSQLCERRSLFLWIGLAASWLYGVTASYFIWSRRLATHNGTVGMGQMGLSIRGTTTNGSISKGRALRRSIIALLPAIFASGAGWIFLFNPSDDVLVIAIIGEAVLSVLIGLGGLWMLFDQQRRTLWDIVGETVVVVDREPSWFAVVSLVFGSLVPLAGTLTLTLIGIEKIRNEFDDVSSGSSSFTRLLVYTVPIGLACIGAIVFGHLGLRATKWDARRLSGRGIAVAGTLIGYSVPALAVLSLAFSFVYDKLSDREERTCEETRKEISIAAESYKTLNGTYPGSITDLADDVYLDDERLDESWDLTTSGDSYEVEGIGDCDGS